MTTFKFIISSPGNGPENMALDEALFTLRSEDIALPSVFRVYNWKKPCITIGYFQPHADFKAQGLQVTRRLTGGLAVTHGHDISYCLVTAEPDWPGIYDQEKTYAIVHEGIKEGLLLAGIKSDFYTEEKKSTDLSLCVKTFFPHDLKAGDRKLVGSSQRRRGKILLQQGSLHLGDTVNFQQAALALVKGWEKVLGVTMDNYAPGPKEASLSAKLAAERYATPAWNEKF